MTGLKKKPQNDHSDRFFRIIFNNNFNNFNK